MLQFVVVWALFSIIVAIVYYFRSYLQHRALLDIDESLYLYMAARTAEDWFPYVSAFDHKGPLFFWLLAPIAHFFSPEILPFRILTTFVLALSMGVIFLAAFELCRDKYLALLAPFVYGMIFFRQKGVAVNTNIYMLLLIAIVVWLFFRGERRGHTWGSAAGQGAAAALAFFIQMNAVVSIFWIPLLYILRLVLDKNRAALRCLVGFALGGVGVTAGFFLVFLIGGHFDRLWEDYFLYNLVYATGLRKGLDLAVERYFILIKEFSPFILGNLALLALLFTRFPEQRKTKYQLLCLYVFTLIAALSPGYMLLHYFLQLALPFSLICVFLLSKLSVKKARVIAGALILLFFVRYQASNSLYPTEDQQQVEQDVRSVVAHIKEHTRPSETIFVWGGQAVFYYLSERRAPIKRFAAIFFDDMELKRDHFESSFEKILRDPPKVIIVMKNPQTGDLPDSIASHYVENKRYGAYRILHLANPT